MRWLFLVHRYLGMAIGVIMVLWCLSGIVMMYVQYPELSEHERLAGLEPLTFGNCCSARAAGFSESMPVNRFQVQMLADRPVLRMVLENPPGELVTLDLRSGQRIDARDPEILIASAESWRRRAGISGSLHSRGLVQNDQWTVYPSYQPHRPMHKFSSGDEAGTEWYVSSTTGEVVQVTTRSERTWNWMGSVVHWLYPTLLRQHAAVWYQVVVWLSLAGIFLTAIGLYIGLKQWKARREGRAWPYRGVALWHHYSGLFFGVFVLIWVTSGLFSMNPWGFLEGEGAAEESGRLRGAELHWNEVENFIVRLAGFGMPRETVQIEGYAQGGRFRLVTHDSRAGRQRFDGATLQPAPVTEDEWAGATQQLLPGETVSSAGLIESEDDYYYDHHVELDYPVYRVVFADPGRSRYYLDAVSGEIVRKVDASQRWYRWLFGALHRGDFSDSLRGRPAWDIFMLLLLGGVTASCATGAYMGLRRFLR